MNIKKAVTGAIAAMTSVAALGAMAAPAFADNGKSLEELAQHGGAQRIAAIGSAHAKNVILFIGDGMGDSEITVARDYLHGASGHFDGLDKIGQPGQLGDVEAGTGQYTTYSLGYNSDNGKYPKKGGVNDKPGVVTPVTDSSASGSSWATGTKTYNNAVDVDIYGNPQLNLVELAKAAGKATGNVTTAEIQDATPAVLESHSTERSCYGPQGKTDGTSNNADKQCRAEQLKENGGIGSISEQLLDTRADVTIGGGAKYFRQTAQGGTYKGKTLWDQAKERGFQTVENDVDAFAGLKYEENKPVLALLGDGNLPTQYNSTPALTQEETIKRGAIRCTPNDAWLGKETAKGNSASLADMTDKALSVLQANPKSSDNGFFLQVEGASIDKQDHAANACGQIGETDDLDQAISKALSKVDLSNTLIIVTADHAHTSQIVNDPPAYALSTILESPIDHAKIVVSYGTATATDPDASDPSKGYNDGGMEHTGTQLRIAASGPGAQRVTGLTDQTDNFYTIGKALGLATETADQKKLSDNAQLTVKADKGALSVDAADFAGDAVLSYSLAEKATKKAVDQSNDTTPFSGVRVATGATTTFPVANAAAGTEYTLTVTGRQSGKAISVDFKAPAADFTGDVASYKPAPAPAPSFTDVDGKTPHHEDISWLAQSGIAEGFKNADGTYSFGGMRIVNRQDMAAFLYRLAGSPTFDADAALKAKPFTDVTNDPSTHYKEVLWAQSVGIAEGYPNGDGTYSFGGTRDVNRQDMAAFLHRYSDKLVKNAPKLGNEVKFTDVDGKTPHHEDIAWLGKAGVTKGFPNADGTYSFGGDRAVVRQDMAAFLHRMSVNVLGK